MISACLAQQDLRGYAAVSFRIAACCDPGRIAARATERGGVAFVGIGGVARRWNEFRSAILRLRRG